ncbi:MAG: trypsin-like peptidase domain-containing protein [Candidatus Limivicinus sp.]|nr:S1C family serine protease [Clostridiales bacterium]MDY6132663.1 trypsin-like peptidase domain-containing protein [Candidatus Limivicinus sp.]
MYEPADNEQKNENTNPEQQSSGGYSGDTDRVNGEYHYKNGYTQKIYSDAHYVPENENTVPPRYYTPPEKPVKAPKEKKPHGKWVKALCLCLVCALLGGVCGAGIMAGSMNSRIAAVEQRLEEQAKETLSIGSQTSSTPAPVSTTTAAKPIAAIYDQACNEVVGITTEVTYTNFFGQTSSSAVSGSGFIVSPDGYILTNYHVIEYAYKGNYAITVMLHDGTRYEASIVGVEDCNDIAVLKIDASGLDPVTFGDSDKLSVGDDVYAVGNPLGELEFSMTTGHVSALDRLITTEDGSEAINMFQIDAAVNSGNSGGPVYNANGEVVGIVTAKYSDTGVEGLGFAIPINDAAKIANDLITKGYVTGKAYMGVSIDERYNSMYSQYYNMPIGAFVKSVESGSCAESAGIQAGDIITRLGDVEITGYSDLKQAIKQYSAGDSAELELYRAGESRTLTVTFDEAVPDSANP